MGIWHHHEINLSGTGTSPLRLRFRFETGKMDGPALQGWVVDNLEVWTDRPTVPPPPPSLRPHREGEDTSICAAGVEEEVPFALAVLVAAGVLGLLVQICFRFSGRCGPEVAL